MDENEINKVIAEFMGWHLNASETMVVEPCQMHSDVIHPLYTKSLDALVPVWEKLRKDFNLCFKINTHDLLHKNETGVSVDMWIGNILITETSDNLKDITIQLAAAKATAMAIKELGENK